MHRWSRISRKRCILALALPAMLASAAGRARAQDAGASAASASGASAWRLQEDNGNFADWVPSRQRTDNNYVQGLRLRIGTDSIFRWAAAAGRFLLRVRVDTTDGGTAPRTGYYEIGQEIYTPPYRPSGQLPTDRPYAGWLYARVASQDLSDGRQQAIALDAGVVGPPSLAGPVQNAFHAITGSGPQIGGWAHQLQFEPGLDLRYDDSHLVGDWTMAGQRVMTLIPHWDVQAGNVHDGADVSLASHLGYGLSHPWQPDGVSSAPIEVYVSGALQGSYVLRNLFLDGSTFRPSPHVHTLPFTSQTEAGFGVRVQRITLEYRGITQAREYVGGPVARKYGSLIAGLAW
jgi:lipid A 3-O-deacylase